MSSWERETYKPHKSRISIQCLWSFPTNLRFWESPNLHIFRLWTKEPSIFNKLNYSDLQRNYTDLFIWCFVFDSSKKLLKSLTFRSCESIFYCLLSPSVSQIEVQKVGNYQVKVCVQNKSQIHTQLWPHQVRHSYCLVLIVHCTILCSAHANLSPLLG